MDLIPIESRDNAFHRLFSDPNILKTICAQVSNGGSLQSLCTDWDIRYSDAVAWVYDRAYPDRKVAYEDSLKARDEWSVEQLLHELRRIGNIDFRDFVDESGQFLSPKNWPEHAAKAVQAFEVRDYTDKDGNCTKTYKIKLWDKIKAIELQGKNRRLFIDKVEHSGSLSLEDLVLGKGSK